MFFFLLFVLNYRIDVDDDDWLHGPIYFTLFSGKLFDSDRMGDLLCMFEIELNSFLNSIEIEVPKEHRQINRLVKIEDAFFKIWKKYRHLQTDDQRMLIRGVADSLVCSICKHHVNQSSNIANAIQLFIFGQ